MNCYYIYQIMNMITGLSYIGKTKNKPERRWSKHLWMADNRPVQYVHRAMAKYGIDNFTFDVIAVTKSLEDLDELEAQLISQHKTLSPNGYNLDPAARKYTARHPSTIEKLRKANIGKKMSPDACKKMSLAKSKVTDEQVREIRANVENMTYRELSEKYNITQSSLCDIRKGRTYKGVL